MSCAISSGALRRLAPLALCASVLVSLCSPARAADPLQDTTSLKFVPETVAFYDTTLRLRELFDRVAKSRAITKLQEVPVVQMGLNLIMTQWQYPQSPQVAALQQWLADPQNQQLIELLKDAVSHEVFIYGGADFSDLLALFDELNRASTAAQFEADVDEDGDDLVNNQLERMLEVLDRHGDDLKLPPLVVGAKLTNAATAEAQLQRLETYLNGVVADQPELQGRLTRETLAGAEFLTLNLDGTLVPWQMLLHQWSDADPQLAQRLFSRLAALKLTLSFGVRDGYLLISLGDNNQHLSQLGQQALLYNRAELAPIRAAAGSPIVSVSYASTRFIEKAASAQSQLDELGGMLKGLVMAADLSDELTEELVQDLDQLFAYIASHAPKPAAVSSYAFLTEEGFESFDYRWSPDSLWDPSARLTILDHLGGDPVMFLAGRRKANPDRAEMLAEVFTRLVYYAQNIPLEALNPDKRDAYVQVSDHLLPLFDELADVTRDKLVPALADGQAALVLDGKSFSDSWFEGMDSDQALPLPELGCVIGVSSAALVKEAFNAYFDIAQRLVDTLHELSAGELQDVFGGEFPAVQLVRPQSRDVEGGTVYYYALPAESGLDPQLAPNGGLSSEFMAVSLLPQFTARLLTGTPLQGEGPLLQADRPLAAAGHLDFARLVDMIEPWINYAVRASMGFDPDGAAEGPLEISQQTHDVLQILRCFRGISSVSYLEANTTVTHTQLRFTDLD